MNLIIGLAAVDEVAGGTQMRQLAHGWMGREPKSGRRLRALGARAFLALAARLDATALPAQREPSAPLAPTRA